MKNLNNKTKKYFFAIYLLLFAILLLLPQAKALAATYYVDIDGVGEDGILGTADDVISSDANPGTSEQPWKTLGRAYTWYSGTGPKVQEGDTVLFKNGSYGSFVESTRYDPRANYYFERNTWITYKAATGHSPTLTKIEIRNEKPYDPNAGKAGSSYLIFDGIDIPAGTAHIENTNYIQIKNCNIADTGYRDNENHPVHLTANYATIEDCNISHGGNGIWFHANNCTFKNNIIHNISVDAIHGSGNNLLIEDCNIYDIDIAKAKTDDPDNWGGYHPDAMHIQFGSTGSGLTIRRNIIHDVNNTQGIAITCNNGNLSDVQIENNLINFNMPDRTAMIIEGTLDCNVVNNTVPKDRIRIAVAHQIPTTITNLYNNIGAVFVDGDNGDGKAWVVNHGNNIFGNNPNGSGGPTYPFTVNSTEVVNYNTNLLFVDAANNDFRLTETSMARDFGDPAHAPATDILGNLRDDKPDAGCYEYGTSTFLYGDVSGNKEISAYDAALTAQYSVGLITLTPDQIKAADVSGNGEVSAYDAALIAQKAVGLIDKFPVE